MAVSCVVKWIGERHFVGIDSGNHSVVLSGQSEGIGVKPSEIVITGERDPAPPWPYRTINVAYRLAGDGLTEKAVSQAIALSQDKYCSVAATVRGVARITTEYTIVNQDAAAADKSITP
ncbi:MAG: hypothetical protein MUF46_02520 [Desulfobacterales bacterium]|nr:hypothetical protein [Desulfobacterales bacterium]